MIRLIAASSPPTMSRARQWFATCALMTPSRVFRLFWVSAGHDGADNEMSTAALAGDSCIVNLIDTSSGPSSAHPTDARRLAERAEQGSAVRSDYNEV